MGWGWGRLLFSPHLKGLSPKQVLIPLLALGLVSSVLGPF